MRVKKKVAIIGGGAAGVFAAINLAEKNPDYEIFIFEANSKALSKVLVSGGGRCNVTNNTPNPSEIIKKYPRGSRELLGPMTVFGVNETISWFRNRGVRLKTEDDNRVFPETDSSGTIANCLLSNSEKAGIKIFYKEKVQRIEKTDKNFIIHLKNTNEFFDSVMLSTGSSETGFKFAENLGHRIIPPVPSLFTFEIEHPLIKGLSGVCFRDSISSIQFEKIMYENRGPLLITHWGLSGPSVIVLSSVAARELHSSNYKATLKLNLIPDLNLEEAAKILSIYRERNIRKPVIKSNPFNIPASFWERFVEFTENKNLTYQELSKKTILEFINKLKSLPFEINGKGKFKEEFVTAGGIDLKEVNFKTMESKICANLFFAGEILDIDGITGGFNFQSAWTTAWIASQNI